MTDQDVREFLERMAAEEPTPFLDVEPLTRRARRRAARTVVVGAVGIAAAIAVLFAGASQLREPSPRVPANPSIDLGIFAPVAGRIVSGVWAVDPIGCRPERALRFDDLAPGPRGGLAPRLVERRHRAPVHA